MSSMEAFAASGRAPKRVVDGDRDWREKRRAGEDVSGQNKAKTRIGGTYVFAGSWRSSERGQRWRLRSGGGSSPVAVGCWTRPEERGRRKGGSARLHRPGVLRGWKGSRADWPLAKRARAACLVGATAAVACRSGARHRRGREGKERGEEGKGMVAADGWGRQRDEGEG